MNDDKLNEQLQTIQKGDNTGSVIPLFCLHHRGGHTLEYRGLVKVVDDKIPIYGIQSQLLSNPSYNESDMTVVAKQYANLIQGTQSKGPYQLLGWSLGGVLATAITQELEARNETVSFLGLIDSSLVDPNQESKVKTKEQASLIENLFEVFGNEAKISYSVLESDVQSQFEQTLNQLRAESGELQAVDYACNWIIQTGLIDTEVIDTDYLRLRYLTTMQSRRLINSYSSNMNSGPEKINAATYIWWAENSLKNNQAPTAWSQYCSNVVQQQQYPGGHFDIMQNITLANELATLLNTNSRLEK